MKTFLNNLSLQKWGREHNNGRIINVMQNFNDFDRVLFKKSGNMVFKTSSLLLEKFMLTHIMEVVDKEDLQQRR